MIAAVMFCLALVVLAFSLRRKKGHTPSVESRVSKDALQEAAAIARRRLEELTR